jgi:hypothetical protein
LPYEQITSKADGVPLFAEELTKTALALGQLQGTLYRAAGPASPVAIPMTRSDSLTARLDRLGPIKRIAQIASVIGREFSYRLLAPVASASGPSLQNALEHLAACELIFVRGEPPDSTMAVRVPNRPSRPKTFSIPSVRRKVCARRSRTASAREADALNSLSATPR